MSGLLETICGYNAWANTELFDTLDGIDPDRHGTELQTALRLIGHYYVVSRIFAGHLQGVPHGFASDSLNETPALDELRIAVTSSDRWYLDYFRNAPVSALSQAVTFTFTNGAMGCMTREEMLTHVVLHGGYHRGEAGRILWQIAVTPPWDTLAAYLRQVQRAPVQ